MRKLILQMQVSVDGYVGKAGGGSSWQIWDWGDVCPWDPPLRDRFNGFLAAADTILLSRKIVEGGYLDHWSDMARRHPREPLFAFAQRIAVARKVVFSRSLTESPWPGTELAGPDLVVEIAALKVQSGRNIVAFGGAAFASSLLTAGVVDELEFYTNPVALGEGLSIFSGAARDTTLQLDSVVGYESGVVVTTYAVGRVTA